MTESSWTAWCPVHKIWIGPAMPKGGFFKKNAVHRVGGQGVCDCPDDELEIRSTFDPPPAYAEVAPQHRR